MESGDQGLRPRRMELNAGCLPRRATETIDPGYAVSESARLRSFRAISTPYVDLHEPSERMSPHKSDNQLESKSVYTEFMYVNYSPKGR
jgi:hypothetical protein